jgi:hypothetical protein
MVAEQLPVRSSTTLQSQYKEPCVSTPVDTTDSVALHVTREDAGLIVDGLQMLLNCHRFAFKEPGEDVRQMHAQLYETVERIEAELATFIGRGKETPTAE